MERHAKFFKELFKDYDWKIPKRFVPMFKVSINPLKLTCKRLSGLKADFYLEDDQITLISSEKDCFKLKTLYEGKDIALKNISLDEIGTAIADSKARQVVLVVWEGKLWEEQVWKNRPIPVEKPKPKF